jgi:hypothetical protein
MADLKVPLSERRKWQQPDYDFQPGDAIVLAEDGTWWIIPVDLEKHPVLLPQT